MKLLIFLMLLISGCSSVFYQPTGIQYSSPDQFELKHDEFFFKTKEPVEDKVDLHAWHIKSKTATPPKGLVVLFHGNAQNISAHYLSVAWMTNQGYDVFVFDYRGYGRSGGTPNQEGIHYDSLAALEEAYKLSKKRKAKRFIVFGQSLGGIIAMRAVHDFKHKDKIDLLVQESTFSSYQGIAKSKLQEHWGTYLLSPLSYVLVSDAYASSKVLDQVKVPTLVIHGTRDLVIPHRFGKEIYQKLKGPKWYWEVKNGIHNNAFFHNNYEYRRKFLDFIEDKLAHGQRDQKVALQGSAPLEAKKE
jgi:hypothetical protein